MKDVLGVRPTFEQDNDFVPAGTARHPVARYRVAPRVAVPLHPVRDPEPAQKDRKPLSEFAVWMIFLAYLAIILTVGYLLWTKFTSD